MIKQLKNIRLAGLTLLILLGVTAALLLYNPTATAPTATGESLQITNISVADIAAVAVKNDEGSFALYVDGESVIVEAEQELNYSLTELRSFIYLTSHMEGLRKLPNSDSPEKYGFDSPAAKVVLITTDKTSLNLLLGYENPLDGSYYLYNEGSKETFSIAASTANYLLRSSQDFATRGIFPAFGTGDLDKIEKLTVSFKEGGNRDFTIKNKGGMRFEMTSPLISRLNTVDVITELLLPILAIYPEEVVTTTASPQDKTLQNPDITLELTVDGKAYGCLLKRNEDGSYLVGKPKDSIIYRLLRLDNPALANDCVELFGGNAYSYSLAEMSSVNVRFGDTNLTIDLSGEQSTLVGVSGDKRYDSSQLTQLFGVLCGVEIASENTDPPSGEPDVIITLTEKNGSSNVIGLFPPTNGLCQVQENGNINFTTTSGCVQMLKDTVKAF